jgi:predicted metal-dependent hydrolase
MKGNLTADLLWVGNLQVEVRYRGVKNLRLTVYPPAGEVRVSAPPHTSAEFIRDFVSSKLPWIEKHRARYRGRSKTGGLEDRETQYVWGRPWELRVVERRGRPGVVVEDGVLRLSVRPGADRAKRQELLDAWRRRVLRETAPALMEKWGARIGVRARGLYVRKMKSHWGSCNYERGTIRLNSELVKKSPLCLEYVILHELIHLIEPSHNRNFYRLLGLYMPSWKEIRRGMNSGAL